jgi:hypothetical protein
MKEFELPSEMTINELLNHPKWEEMILNHHFREALLGMIGRREKEKEYFIEKWEERRIYYERSQKIPTKPFP